MQQDMPADTPAGLPCPNSSSSFWHSEPSHFLLGHRTTSDLPADADIVIVGSGITGASVARYLAEDDRAKGLSVVMLEAREACWGATGRNGGHCQPLVFDRTPEVAEFELRNVAAVKKHIEDYNVDCEWRQVTSCRAFWHKSAFKAAEQEIAKLQKTHPHIGEIVRASTDAQVLRDHRVNTSAVGVTLTQGAGSLWPYKYVTDIIERLARKGSLNFQSNTPVTKIAKSHGGWLLETPRGPVKAKDVILATNGYTSHVLQDFASLIVPIRCEMSALHPPAGSSRLEHSYGMVGYAGGHVAHDDYLIQRPFYTDINGNRKGGHLMFGGGRGHAQHQCIGVTDDDIVDQGEAAYLRKSLLGQLTLGGTENSTELTASHQWTGIKGNSRDDMPWVGAVPGKQGVWLAGGYSGHGMPNATLCGKAVVDMVLAARQGHGYEATCEALVGTGGLPRSYVITAARLEAAKALPTVLEQEAAHSPRTEDSSKCSVM